MFANRISGFTMYDDPVERREAASGCERANFVPLPAFVIVGGNMSAVPDIYRIAYEQAQRDVARRRERERRLHEWN
jgi:hypothetical protein